MEPARLLVAAPDGPELQYVLEVEQVVIGRDEGCTVVLSRKGVSRRHARVRIADDEATVEDLGSTNGTRLNGKRLEPGRTRSPAATASRSARSSCATSRRARGDPGRGCDTA